MADAIEQRGLAVVDVTHHRDDGRARLEQRFVVFVVVGGEQRDQLDLLLAARLDDEDLRAEGLGDQLDHLVGERCGCRHHLAGLEQDAHEIGGRTIQLRRVLLNGAAARDDDLALGNRRVHRGEPLRRRFELGAIATALLATPLRRSTGSSPTAGATTESARTTRTAAGTASAATGRAGATSARATARSASRTAAGRVSATATSATRPSEAATSATAGCTATAT